LQSQADTGIEGGIEKVLEWKNIQKILSNVQGLVLDWESKFL